MRALVVDDEEVYRHIVRSALEKRGWSVDEAWDGQVGWQLFQLADYDLIVTDIVMPHQEGLETIQLMRASRPDVRILAISGGGRHSPDYLSAARWFGANQALAKPFSESAFRSAVDSLMGPTAKTGNVVS